MTRLWSASSIFSRRSDSSALMRMTGMPVHMLTTWAMSSSVTTGVSFDWSSCHLARSSSIALLALGLLVAKARGGLVVLAGDRLVLAGASISSSASWASLISGGADAERSRTRDPASSTRSIALSGRARSAT